MDGRGSRRIGLRAWHRLWRGACAAAVVVGVTGCGAVQCKTADVGIWPHPGKPKPAVRVVVTCDGKPKVVLDADRKGEP